MAAPDRRALFAAAPLALAAMPAAAAPRAAARETGRVTAEAFGARGDGRTDDAPAIQAAINALGAQGGVVLLGARTYRLGRGLVMDPTRVSISGVRSVLDGRGLPDGSALLTVASAADAPQYGQATQVVEGLILRGRGADSRSTGIALATAAPARSSRITLRNCVVSDFGTGLDYGPRAYLCQSYSIQVYNCATGVAFSSRDDAGECISFHGCSIFNSGLAVANREAAIVTFTGCAFSYCRTWFRGNGLNTFFGSWFEKHRPETEDDIPFDLGTGDLIFHGGGIQISGVGFAEGNRNRFMFMARDRQSRIVLRDCFAWNWRSATGVLAGGEGSVVIDGLAGQGNRYVPTIIKDDRRHNVFGDSGRVTGDALTLPCWVGGAAATRESAQVVRWGSMRGEAGLSTERPRSGSRCLRVLKGIGPGTDFTFNLATPIEPGQGFGTALWYRVAGPGPVGPIWFQVFWARHLATDAHGAMRFGETQFWGEVQTSAVPAEVAEWRQVQLNSRSLDSTATAPQEAPAWASHVLITASMVAAGEGTELFLADIGGWMM